ADHPARARGRRTERGDLHADVHARLRDRCRPPVRGDHRRRAPGRGRARAGARRVDRCLRRRLHRPGVRGPDARARTRLGERAGTPPRRVGQRRRPGRGRPHLRPRRPATAGLTGRDRVILSARHSIVDNLRFTVGGVMPTIGLLYPGHSAEDDYTALEERVGSDLRLPLVHTSVGEDAHRVDALLDLGGTERLAQGARTLVDQHAPDSIMWACTSGSFVFGWEGAQRQVKQLEDLTGLPTSSTSIAFVEACRSLGLTRVTVAASYPQDVAQEFVSFLGRGGIEVTAMGSHGIITAAEVGTLDYPQVDAIVRGADRSGGAEAVLVP